MSQILIFDEGGTRVPGEKPQFGLRTRVSLRLYKMTVEVESVIDDTSLTLPGVQHRVFSIFLPIQLSASSNRA